MSSRILASGITLLSLCLADATSAQGAVDLPKLLPFAVPTSPSLQFIGASPAKVERPSSGPEIFTSLLSAIDTAGRVQQGFALDLAPAQFLWRNMDVDEYESPGGFILANTTLSSGTARSSGDSSSTTIGFGVRTVFLDNADPLSRAASAAGDAAIQQALTACLPPGPVNRNDPVQVKNIRTCLQRADSTFRAEYRRLHWNDYSFAAGGATGWGLKNSEWNEREWLGFAVWAVGAAPLCFRVAPRGVCNRGQWVAQIHHERRDSTFDGPGRNRTALGVRGNWGSGRFNLFAEGLQLWTHDAPSGVDDSYNEWSGGLEFRVTDELWVATGFGSRFNDATRDSEVAVIANLRFNVAPTRMLQKIVPGAP
ncbi:MAG TPA: hypothetical protein VHG08_16955 [Longimicrobium sp.]|nr:hypothetical protein [Longimicrobium sp.]